MLKLLRVNNIALISSLDLELGPGLTLLTGETGAGKSILIDALGLVLGDRASPDLIRSGEERGTVEAVFEVPGAAALLDERGLPGDGDEIVLRRELQASGKGRASANGALVPVSLLRELAPRLAIVHGQHEPQGLLDAASHLALVDHFAGDDATRPIGELYRDLRSAEAALERLRGDRREGERRREMLEFQAGEIEQAGLVLIDQPPAFLGCGPVLAGDLQRRIEPRCLPLDHGERVARLRRHNGRRAALEDAGLFSRDLFERVAEKINVVDRNARDDGGERMIDHIGRVQAAAEPNFHQQHVGRMAREQQ